MTRDLWQTGLALGIGLALLAGAQLGGQLSTFLPGQTPVDGAQQAAAPTAANPLERVLDATVTLYAERAVAEPVMITTGPDTPAGDANIEQPREGWSWRTGSGFAVHPGGYVLTNHHVIDGARRIEARLADGQRVRATLVGADPLTDLALVRIEADLPVLEWGDVSGLRIGQRVLAVGSPLDFHLSVSSGVTGGFARAYDGADPVGYLQHDAALNPGSSGGPLINEAGQVVGVNTAIPQEAFFNVGISLAIPADTARAVSEALLNHGRVERGYLGVSVRALHGSLASAMGRASGQGVLIETVETGSPAAEAGLRPGDTLLSVNGERLSAPRDLARVLLMTRPGQTVTTSVHDGQARIQLAIVLEARADAAPGWNRDLGHRSDPGLGFGIVLEDRADGRGVGVADIVPGSPAARAGLRAGDRILSIGTSELDDPAEARVRLALTRSEIALRVIRAGEGEPRFIALTYAPGASLQAPDHASFADAAGGPY